MKNKSWCQYFEEKKAYGKNNEMRNCSNYDSLPAGHICRNLDHR